MGSKAGILCPCEKPVLASVLLPLAVAFAQRNKLAYFLAINLIRSFNCGSLAPRF